MSKLKLPVNASFKDLQDYVRDMEVERGFTKDDVTMKCMLLAEEVGELIKCIRKSHTKIGIDNSKDYKFDPAGEIADILIVLTTIANRLNIDMEQALSEKEELNKKRNWV